MMFLCQQGFSAYAQNTTPDMQNDSQLIDPPDAEVPPEDRLDALEPFDPEALDPETLEKSGPLQDYIDPDNLDEGLKDLLQNLPEEGGQIEGLPDLPTIGNEAEVSPDTEIEKPDYSKLSKSAEKEARLEILFNRLGVEENTERAELIAEEIWAIWLDSGSASVDLLIRRGTAAQKKGDVALARRMYDHVTQLMPEYAEGWSRSARLAIEEEDLGRALSETTEALIREPRHFYALWTMGNLLERLGRQEAALEAYVEAHRLYPKLKAVKDRVTLMRGSVEGDVL